MLRAVDQGSAFAVELLHGDEVSQLGRLDRALVTQLVMGVLRWRGDLDFEIERLSGRPRSYFDAEVLTLLRLGLYQIRHLRKIPKPAAVNEAVEMAKRVRRRSAAGLINAVLHRAERASFAETTADEHQTAPAAAELIEAARRSHPEWMLGRWRESFGSAATERLALWDVSVPVITLRANTSLRNQDPGELARELAAEGVETRPGRYSPEALLVVAGDAQAARAFAEGAVVIQDEASQLVASLVAPRPGDRVLDLCSAPGIKAAQIASAIPNLRLVACDLSSPRLSVMRRMLPRLAPSAAGADLVRLDARADLPFAVPFDRILVDAPCSGTGTLARNPEIRWRLTPEDLPRLAAIQMAILHRACHQLDRKGRIVYATCSLEPEENEHVVDAVLSKRPDLRLLSGDELGREFPHLSELFDSHGFLHTRPDLHQTDGFFAAVLVRR
jgi:16S rRNA (cytosine967-C5)-methyltransferase